jgi:Trypsin-like peptidase domain
MAAHAAVLCAECQLPRFPDQQSEFSFPPTGLGWYEQRRWARRAPGFRRPSMSTLIDIASTITAKLHLYRRDQLLGPATGFFSEWNGQFFLITNWHVVSGLHPETKKPLHSLGGIPDRVKFRVAVRGDIGEWISPIECLLYEDSDSNELPERPIWLEHPIYHDRLDVVAIPIRIPNDGAVRTIDAVNTVPKMRLKVATDVFVLGYPMGIDGGGEFPIWKRASIATEPGVHRGGPPHILIDTATRKGMSGAPVIAIADGDFEVEGAPPAYRPPGRVYRFVGVYSSRLGDGEMEAQLGRVWDAALLEIIVKTGTPGTSSKAWLSSGSLQ